MSYKLLIFDWDGTLMDSEAKIVHCLEESIEYMNLSPKTNNELKNVIGLGLFQAIYTLYPDISEKNNHRFANYYRETYVTKKSSVLFDRVIEMLHSLKSTGVMLAVATGKGRQGLNYVLEEVGLEQFFHASRCADETFSKPNPKMLEEILDEFALLPENAIMIGDTDYDLQMANNIKMDCIAVSYGVHERERLSLCSPKAIFNDVKSLAVFLSHHT